MSKSVRPLARHCIGGVQCWSDVYWGPVLGLNSHVTPALKLDVKSADPIRHLIFCGNICRIMELNFCGQHFVCERGAKSVVDAGSFCLPFCFSTTTSYCCYYFPRPIKNRGRGLAPALATTAAARHTRTGAGLGGPPGHSGALFLAWVCSLLRCCGVAASLPGSPRRLVVAEELLHENPPFRDHPKMNYVKVAVFG